MEKKNKVSEQDIILNHNGRVNILTRFPHAGKGCESRVMTGRGFGKTAMIRIIDGKPVLIGNEGEIILEEDSMFTTKNIPADYRPKLKVVTMEELKERYEND